MFLKTKPLTYNFLLQRARTLTMGWSESGGRSSSGRITSFKKGSFKFRRIYKFIDFWRRLTADAFIVKLEKDTFRSSSIALVFYQTGFLSYLLLPGGYRVGDKLKFSLTHRVDGVSADFPGNACMLKNITEGSFVFNVEIWPLKGGQICRSAGTYAVVIGNRNGFVTLKLRSGWKFVVSERCYATLGVASDISHIYDVIGKAGRRVNLGRRPTVRGVAMNPIDHPHGGGRGKTSGGKRPRSPWGWITKQVKTVSAARRVACATTRFR